MPKKIPYSTKTGKDGLSVPAVRLAKSNPKLAAIVSKSERGRIGLPTDARGNIRSSAANAYLGMDILSKRAKHNTDAGYLKKLIPELELCTQILVSAIQSPKDLSSTEVIVQIPEKIFSHKLTNDLHVMVKDFFTNDYKIGERVSDMLRKILVTKGSYPVAVIPENTLDQFINSDIIPTTESLSTYFDSTGNAKNLGWLGTNKQTNMLGKMGVRLESLHRPSVTINPKVCLRFDEDAIDEVSGLLVTDNPAALRVPALNSLLSRRKTKEIYTRNSSLESLDKYNDTTVQAAIYRARTLVTEPVSSLPGQRETKRKSVGEPLVIEFPSESVLPVHVPGSPDQHVGYYILIDENGHPVRANEADLMDSSMKKSSNTSVGTNMIRRVSSNMGIEDDQFDPRNHQQRQFMSGLYAELIEKDLISRVKNGVYGGAVEVAKNEEAYRLMLSRVLAKKQSQILFIPAEYMTYMAFDYNDNGIGKSLIDDISAILVIRTVLLFSDVMASVRNSIGRTKVSMTLDAADADPFKLIEEAQDEIVRSRMINIPTNINSPADIMDFIQRAGYMWDFGNVPGLPDLKFDFENTNSNFTKSDPELQDALRKATIAHFGLTPEMVENGLANQEFAVSIVTNNELFSKRVVGYQDRFTPQLTEHARQYLKSSGSFIEKVQNLFEESRDDILIGLDESDTDISNLAEDVKSKLIIRKAIDAFIGGFNLSLPRPTTTTVDNQLTDIKNYSDAIDTVLDSLMSSELFSKSLTGNLEENAGTIKATYKAYLVRKFLNSKNLFPEAFDILAGDEADKTAVNVVDDLAEHEQKLSQVGVKLFVTLSNNVKAVNKDLDKFNVQEGSSEFTDNSGGGSSSSDSSSSDDGMGGFDMGDDFNMGDTPTDDATDGTAADDGGGDDDTTTSAI
jgi:hypothetical protein